VFFVLRNLLVFLAGRCGGQFLDLAGILRQYDLFGANSLHGHRIFVSIVFAADSIFRRASIATAAASSSAREAVCGRVPVKAACSTLANADIPAAGGVDVAREGNAMCIGASLVEGILALRGVRGRILVAILIGAALAVLRGTRISTARTELVALVVDAVLIGAALGVQWHTQMTAAFIVVRADELRGVVVPGAHVQRYTVLQRRLRRIHGEE